jgi:antitoxin component YwqK of YwqJK toxin-antitoxin module
MVIIMMTLIYPLENVTNFDWSNYMNKQLTFLLSLIFLFMLSSFAFGEEAEVKREYWGNGQLKRETHLRSGEKNGIETTWYESGGKTEESNFLNGDKDGASIFWDSDGRKKWQGYYAIGKLNGSVTRWYENGLKLDDHNYKEGIEVSSAEWYENGNKKYEDDGHHHSTEWNENGNKIEERYLIDGFNDDYDDGSLRYIVINFYSSGEKYMEANVKDFYLLDGLARYFYRSGEIMRDEYYKDGKKEGLVTEWYESGRRKYELNYNNGEQIGLGTHWNKDGTIGLP